MDYYKKGLSPFCYFKRMTRSRTKISLASQNFSLHQPEPICTIMKKGSDIILLKLIIRPVGPVEKAFGSIAFWHPFIDDRQSNIQPDFRLFIPCGYEISNDSTSITTHYIASGLHSNGYCTTRRFFGVGTVTITGVFPLTKSK